jgi:hypothetical protein
MFSVFACCAAPAKADGVEVVAVRKEGVFADHAVIGGPGMETFNLTEAEVPKKKGLSYDSRLEDNASVSTMDSRFDRYERKLSSPMWEKDERHKSWAPEFSRSGPSMPSPRESTSPQDEARREERLEQLVAELRPTLAEGVRVNLIDASTQLLCQCLLKLDMVEQTMSLTTAFSDERSFRLKDMASIYKGSEFARKHPDLAHLSSAAICVDFWSDEESDEPTFLHFDDAGARNDFYAFAKIARMAADNVEAFKASR